MVDVHGQDHSSHVLDTNFLIAMYFPVTVSSEMKDTPKH